MREYNELCWNSGVYSDLCDCALCSHKDECSGADLTEDDD